MSTHAMSSAAFAARMSVAVLAISDPSNTVSRPMFRTKLLSFIDQAGQGRTPSGHRQGARPQAIEAHEAEDAAMRRVDDAQVIW
jgi:hypothetical protein